MSHPWRFAPKSPLSVTHPELAAQWHPTKNAELTPGSGKKVWWQCAEGSPMGIANGESDVITSPLLDVCGLLAPAPEAGGLAAEALVAVGDVWGCRSGQ